MSIVRVIFFRGIPFRSVSFRASELALPRNSECLGMNTFFRGITETVPSLFRGIFPERNSVPNPTTDSTAYFTGLKKTLLLYYHFLRVGFILLEFLRSSSGFAKTLPQKIRFQCERRIRNSGSTSEMTNGIRFRIL
jgi:hypothetical protein